MIRHKGGQKVGKGTYWDITSGERVDVKTEETLPGGPKKTYYRMPAAGVLLLGPILGLIYAAFLPFIGIAMAVKMVGQKLAGGTLEQVQSSASFGWRPSESYLAGKKKGLKPAEKKEEGSGEPADKQ